MRMSRKPEIIADAAYAILTRNSREATGNFYIDDDVLRSAGVTDLDKYAVVPGESPELLTTVFARFCYCLIVSRLKV